MFFERSEFSACTASCRHLVHVEAATLFTEIVHRTLIGTEYGIAIFPIKVCQLFMCACFHIVLPDIARNRRSMVLAPDILATFLILVHHHGSFGIHINSFSGRGKDLSNPSACHRHLVQLAHVCGGILPICGIVIPCTGKDNLFFVCTKGIWIFRRAVIGQSCGLATRCRNREHIEIPISVARKRDGFAIPAPDRHKIMSLMKGQHVSRTPGTGNGIQIPFEGEYDGLPIGRNSRIS